MPPTEAAEDPPAALCCWTNLLTAVVRAEVQSGHEERCNSTTDESHHVHLHQIQNLDLQLFNEMVGEQHGPQIEQEGGIGHPPRSNRRNTPS